MQTILYIIMGLGLTGLAVAVFFIGAVIVAFIEVIGNDIRVSFGLENHYLDTNIGDFLVGMFFIVLILAFFWFIGWIVSII